MRLCVSVEPLYQEVLLLLLFSGTWKINRYSGGYTELCSPEKISPFLFLFWRQLKDLLLAAQHSSFIWVLHSFRLSTSIVCLYVSAPFQEVTQQSNCTSGRRQLQTHSFNKTSVVSCIAARECKILLIKLQGCNVDAQLKTTE